MLKIGWASRDVSENGPVLITGQVHQRISKGVKDPTTVTALVMEDGGDYVVLLEMEDTEDGEEQILVTRLEEENGEMSFVVAEEEDVISAVFAKYVALSTQTGLDGLKDAE